MADMKRIEDRIKQVIYPNGTGAITAAEHQTLLIEMVEDINIKKADEDSLLALAEDKVSHDDLATINGKRIDKGGNITIEGGAGNFDEDGKYPNLVAGDLYGHGESVPAEFSFRATGGKSIKDGTAYIKELQGNAVVWNQLAKKNAGTSSAAGLSAIWEGEHIRVTGTFEPVGDINIYSLINIHGPFRNGDKYLIKTNSEKMAFYSYNAVSGDLATSRIVEIINDAGEFGATLRPASSYDVAGTEFNEIVRPQVINLTKMFQAGNEPTTIEEYEARKPIVADEYSYNEGEVIAFNGDAVKSVGDNAWDEQWEVGGFDGNGQPANYANRFRSKNYIAVLPNAEYYTNKYLTIFFYDADKEFLSYMDMNSTTFVTPQNCRYMRFYVYGEEVYHNDVILSLVHSGWKVDTDAGYQPYWADTLSLPIISKYFPDGMKSAGTAHDEIRFNKASGKWEYSKGRIKSVDLGTLDWFEGNYNGYSAFYSRYNALNGLWADHIFYLCAKYQPAEYRIYTEGLDKSIAFNNGYYGNRETKDEIVIRDTSYTDAATFKASLQGVMLYYESNDWEWVELDEVDQNFRNYYKVADFGTEELIASQNSAPFKAKTIYQFNAVDQIRENYYEIQALKAQLASIQTLLTSLTSN